MKSKSLNVANAARLAEAAGFNKAKFAGDLITAFTDYTARRIAEKMECPNCPLKNKCENTLDTPCLVIIREYLEE